MKNNLKNKLAAYSALSGTFLVTGQYDVEAQIVYHDVPDNEICVNVTNTSAGGFMKSSTSIGIDLINGMVGNAAPGDGIVNIGLNAFVQPGIRVKTGIGNQTVCTLFGAGSVCATKTKAGKTIYSRETVKPMPMFMTYPGFKGNAAVFGGSQGFLLSSNSSFVSNLQSGNIISEGGTFLSFQDIAGVNRSIRDFNSNSTSSVYDSNNPNWVNNFPPSSSVTDGFLGVQFENGGDTHYGWIRLDMNQEISLSQDKSTYTVDNCITIKDFAYNSIPNGQIIAGDIRSIPTVGQWGIIILGFITIILGLIGIKMKNPQKVNPLTRIS